MVLCHSQHAPIRLSATPQSARTHTHKHTWLPYSQLFTRHCGKANTHRSFALVHHQSWTHTHERTPLWQIWHPPPVVTSLQPPPSLRHGCYRSLKVLKSRRLFPVNLLSLLYVVVQMFWGKVCRRLRMARYNSSERAAAGGVGTRHRKAEMRQPAGHRSRLPQVTVCLNWFHICRDCTSLSHTSTLKQTHCWDSACVFVSKISPLFQGFCFRRRLMHTSAQQYSRDWNSRWMDETLIDKFSFSEVLQQLAVSLRPSYFYWANH